MTNKRPATPVCTPGAYERTLNGEIKCVIRMDMVGALQWIHKKSDEDARGSIQTPQLARLGSAAESQRTLGEKSFEWTTPSSNLPSRSNSVDQNLEKTLAKI